MSELLSERIRETRTLLYAHAGGRCETCGLSVDFAGFELAHRIAQTKTNLKKYGPEVIHHPLNLAVTHAGGCNDAQNIGGRPVEADALAERIRRAISEGGLIPWAS